MKIKENLIPPSAAKRPMIRQSPKFVTVHSTGNPSSTAKNERAWLVNKSNTRQASFHVVVDEKEAICCIPYREVAYHAGDGQGNGNRASIGVELCESGSRVKVLKNGANVVAQLLLLFGLGSDKMVQHHHWSGKNCPRILRDSRYTKDGMDWAYFKGLVETELISMMTKQQEIILPGGKNLKLPAVELEGSNYVAVRPLLENLGYVVGWQNGKVIVEK